MELDWWVLAAVLVGLAGFAVGFDQWVTRLIDRGYDHGFMSLIVTLGVAVVGVGFTIAVRSLVHGLVLLACFAAAGVPMIAGDVRRYVRARGEAVAEAHSTAHSRRQGVIRLRGSAGHSDHVAKLRKYMERVLAEESTLLGKGAA